MPKSSLICLAVLVACTLTLATKLSAQVCSTPGCLDQTFGAGGLTQTYIPATKNLSGAKATKQSDGKIVELVTVLPGDTFTNTLIRYNANGSLDATFGTGGTKTLNWTNPSTNMGVAGAIAIQTVASEERIVVAGTGTGFTSSLRVDRFLSDGSLDTSFGTNGTASITAGDAQAIAVQPDGKILTMGTAGALVRLNSNGTLDTTFGTGGYIQKNIWKVHALALQPDGRILAAGYWTDVKGTAFGSVWRFNTNGSLDDGSRSDSTKSDTFGKAGQALLSSLNMLWDVKVDASGKAVVGGSARVVSTDFAAARLTTSGVLDPTFGVNGITTIDFSGLGDQVRGVVLQSNGKIILTGFTNNSAVGDAGFVRLSSNGSLDTTFGQGGKAVSDLSSEGQSNFTGLVQVDPVCICEKLVTPGTVISGGIYYAVVARYLL